MRWALLFLVACNPLPPPPVMPTYAFAAPDSQGTTTAMIVVGLAEQPLGSGGFGVALRVEHQQTDRSTLGVELTGGGQDGRIVYADGSLHRGWLVGARGYGRYATNNNVDLTCGAGLVYLGNGALVGQLHAGALVGGQSDHVGATAQVALALAVPLLHGESFGAPPTSFDRRPAPPQRLVPLASNLFASFDVAGLVNAGDHDRIAVDAALVLPLIGSDALLGLSVADAVH